MPRAECPAGLSERTTKRLGNAIANRTFDQDSFQVIHRRVTLFCSISVSEAVTPVPTLQRWVYPTFGAATAGGVPTRAYTTATAPGVLPTGAAYPLQFQYGSEGVLTVARTAIGKYTLSLQDDYQRLVGLYAYAAVASGTPTFAVCTENTTISNYTGTGVPGSIVGLAFWDFAAAAVDPIGMVRIVLELADATEP